MKRISSILLLLAFAAFFIEAVKIPAVCPKPKVSTCAMKAGMHMDCKKMMAKHKQQKGKCTPQTCPDCPLCMVTTFNAEIRFSLPRPTHKIEYPVMLNHNLSDYHSTQWKPPNASLI